MTTFFHRTSILLNLASFTNYFPKIPALQQQQPSSSSSSLSSLPNLLERANISKVAFIRHGNTAPKPPNNGDDFDRTLTILGERQALIAGKSYGRKMLNPIFPVVLCSPAPRTINTCELFLKNAATTTTTSGDDDDEASLTTTPDDEKITTTALTTNDNNNNDDNNDNNNNNYELLKLSQFYDGTMQPGGPEIFRKLGYAPLRRYLDNPNNDDRLDATRILGNYANDVLTAISSLLIESKNDEEKGVVVSVSSLLTNDDDGDGGGGGAALLFFGHAIYLPAAALGVANACGLRDGNDVDVILDTNTKEAEGYLIKCRGDDKGVSLLCRPES